MKRIHRARQPYRIREDVRAEPIRVGKYVYLALLGVVVLIIAHLALGHLYLLRGDGFVFASSEVVALEFDATVTELYVTEGQEVPAGTDLFRFQSKEMEKELTTLALRITDLERAQAEDRIRLAETEANLRAAERYVSFATTLDDHMQKLRERGLVTANQLSTEAKRSFEARESLVGYKAQREQLLNSQATLESSLARVRAHYGRLAAIYNEGLAQSRNGGVITSLQVSAGSVVRKGEPVLRLFGDDRYILAYFDERSLVAYEEGDQVIVSLPGGRWKLGRIRELTRVSNRLPEEFQPRFKPLQRHQLAVIDLAPEVLRRQIILSKVSLFMPAGLQWILGMP